MKEMRKKIQKHQSELKKKKLEERKKKDQLKVETRKNPFHRKHGDTAEKKRIQSLAHLSEREKKRKIKNIDAGTPGKSTNNSKTVTKDKFGRKLSPYQMKQAERKAATQQKAKNKNADWKKMRAGTMSKEEFIKKYPRSQTARKYGKK